MGLLEYILSWIQGILDGIKEHIFGNATGFEAFKNLIGYIEEGIRGLLDSPTKLVAITIFLGILLMIGKTIEKILEISFIIFFFMSIVSIIISVI